MYVVPSAELLRQHAERCQRAADILGAPADVADCLRKLASEALEHAAKIEAVSAQLAHHEPPTRDETISTEDTPA